MFSLFVMGMLMLSVSTKTVSGIFTPPKGSWSLCEAKEGEASFDKDVYCARLRGPMALIDGTSANNRYYSYNLWDKTIDENAERLKDEGLFGALGHEQKLDEEALSDGKVTHKVTRLWINEANKTVDGEILVLNSSSGKELNTYLRSGMKISVSSRAYGKFKGKTPNGADIIDEDGFYLQGFDFVLNPGVESANPKLVESSLQPKKEERKMELNEAKFIESLTERAKLQTELSESVKAQDKAEKSLNEAKAENVVLSKELNEAKARLAWLSKNFAPKPVSAVKELNEGIAKYLMIPEFQAVAKEWGIFDTLGTTYAETSKKLMESVKDYSKHGTEKQVAEKLARLAQYEELASKPEVVAKALDMLESFLDMKKSPEELMEAHKKHIDTLKVRDQAKKIVSAKRIVEKLGIKDPKQAASVEAAALKMLESKIPAKEVYESVKSLIPAAQAKTNAKVPTVTTTTKLPTKKLNESAPASKTAKAHHGTVPSGNDASRAMKLVTMMKYNPIVTPND